LRGLGCGFLPEHLARPYVETGRLVVKAVDRPRGAVSLSYAWRGHSTAVAAPAKKSSQAGAQPARAPHNGRALSWWLEQLARPQTQGALVLVEHKHTV
jgi:DNA-binding transcriptional LysR family regulator